MADFLSTLFGGGAQDDAAAKNAAALPQTPGTANAALGTGYHPGVTHLNNAVGAYQPLANLGQQYSQAGNLHAWQRARRPMAQRAAQAAQAAFTNAPGYSGAIDAGLSAIDRQRASMGMANSGNANLDAQTFGQNLQNQQYNTWLQNLSGLSGQGLTATGQAAARARRPATPGLPVSATSTAPTRATSRATSPRAPWPTTTWWRRGRPRGPKIFWVPGCRSGHWRWAARVAGGLAGW